MGLIQDLYAAQKDNQTFLHTRFGLGEDDPAGLGELMVFYCESAAGFSNEFGNQDEGYLYALVHMFEQALKVISQLPAGDRDGLILRLDRVRAISHNLGYGVGDAMDSMVADCVDS